MNKLNEVNDLITKARVILFDVIKEKTNGDTINFNDDNQPAISFEDDDGLHILKVTSIDTDKVYFEDETDLDLGDLDTDQLNKLAQELYA